MKVLLKKENSLLSRMICLFFLSIPFDTFEIVNNSSLPKLFAILVIITCFISIKPNKAKFKFCSTLKWLLLLNGLTFLQIFYTSYPKNTINKFSTLILYFIMITLISQFEYSKEEIKRFIKCFCYSSLLCIILSFIFPFYYEGRLTIQFPGMHYEDPNQFCGYLIPGIVYFMYNLFSQKNGKIKNFLLCITLLYYSLLTGSRGGFLAIIFSSIILIFIYDNSKNIFSFKNLKRLLLLLGGILITYLLISNLNAELFERFTINNMIESKGTGRTEIWDFYIDYFNNSSIIYKIFGYGFGSLSSIYRVAHNTGIEVLIENGIIGLIFFSLFIFSMIRSLLISKNYVVLCILFGYIGLTLSLSLITYKPIWILTILTIIMVDHEKRKEKNEKVKC